ncbi:MAG: SDR family oxidoreductase [Phycisphaerae bacterium]
MDFSAYNNLPVLVTGGAGFIGSHLVRGLLDAGAKVRVLDNLSQGSKSNLREIESRIEFVLGDITDHTSCRQAVRGREIVFHLAALGSVPGSVADPIGYNAVNIGGTLNVLESARLEKVRRVVYSASSAAYGDSPTLPKRETMKPAPKSPYAVGKYTGELYAAVYAKVYGLSTISLRYFNVFGPRQNPRSAYAAVIPAFITAVLENRRPQIYGDGGQTRDFCHVSNVVYANMLAGICLQPPAGEVVNIACAENISLNALLERIIKLVGQSASPEYLPPRAGDVRDSLADISLARAVIGYEPILYFNQGLEQTVPWYRDAVAKMQPPANN